MLAFWDRDVSGGNSVSDSCSSSLHGRPQGHQLQQSGPAYFPVHGIENENNLFTSLLHILLQQMSRELEQQQKKKRTIKREHMEF